MSENRDQDQKNKGEIEVKFLGSLQNVVGFQTLSFKIHDKITLKKLIDMICKKTERNELSRMVLENNLGTADSNIVILINSVESGSLKGLETEVESESSVVFLPIAHGGACA